MKTYGLRDIIGPVMVGPSSSHTAGALRIASIARKLFGATPPRRTIHAVRLVRRHRLGSRYRQSAGRGHYRTER